MYHLPEVNARVREQNRATREAVETIKSQRIIEITNSRAGIRNKFAWQKLMLADWLENSIPTRSARVSSVSTN